MVIRFIFFRSFQKYIMGMDVRKTKGFREFYIRKFIYFKQMDIWDGVIKTKPEL